MKLAHMLFQAGCLQQVTTSMRLPDVWYGKSPTAELARQPNVMTMSMAAASDETLYVYSSFLALPGLAYLYQAKVYIFISSITRDSLLKSKQPLWLGSSALETFATDSFTRKCWTSAAIAGSNTTTWTRSTIMLLSRLNGFGVSLGYAS